MTREVIASPLLGEIETGSECEMSFPFGIPGFEEMRRVVPVEIPAQRPLIYLLDAAHPETCFLALPVFVIDPRFKLTMTEDECAAIGLPESPELPCEPKIGEDVLCLALLVPSERTVQANLGCPVVVNLRNLRGIQCAPPDGYSNCLKLSPEGVWEPAC
jgi:flagellar assembly factor FliW